MILPPDIEAIAVSFGKNDTDLIALGANLNGEARFSTKVPKTVDSPYTRVRGDLELPIQAAEEYMLFSGFIQFDCFAWLAREDIKPDYITAKLVARTLVAKLGTLRGKVGEGIVTGVRVNAGPVRMPDNDRGWGRYRVDSTWIVKRSS